MIRLEGIQTCFSFKSLFIHLRICIQAKFTCGIFYTKTTFHKQKSCTPIIAWRATCDPSILKNQFCKVYQNFVVLPTFLFFDNFSYCFLRYDHNVLKFSLISRDFKIWFFNTFDVTTNTKPKCFDVERPEYVVHSTLKYLHFIVFELWVGCFRKYGNGKKTSSKCHWFMSFGCFRLHTSNVCSYPQNVGYDQMSGCAGCLWKI